MGKKIDHIDVKYVIKIKQVIKAYGISTIKSIMYMLKKMLKMLKKC
jgi:hypothetical protein